MQGLKTCKKQGRFQIGESCFFGMRLIVNFRLLKDNIVRSPWPSGC